MHGDSYSLPPMDSRAWVASPLAWVMPFPLPGRGDEGGCSRGDVAPRGEGRGFSWVEASLKSPLRRPLGISNAGAVIPRALVVFWRRFPRNRSFRGESHE